MSDLITEVNDASESNAQRLSLLRLALNDSFLDELAEKYKVYKRPHDARLQAIETRLAGLEAAIGSLVRTISPRQELMVPPDAATPQLSEGTRAPPLTQIK